MRTPKKAIAGLLTFILTFSLLQAILAFPVYAAVPDYVEINQIYGGGGKGATPFSHSFIELYNPTESEVDLSNYKITYSSNRDNSNGKHAGSTWQSDGTVEVRELKLKGSIQPKHSFLIRCAEEKTDVAVVSLEAADMDWTQVIDNDQSVEVILYNGDHRVDAISTRTTEFQSVGEGDQPATDDISKQKSLRRTNFDDTNNNAEDFKLLVWNDLAEDQKQEFINTYRPRSGADGAWTEALSGNGEDVDPVEPEKPTQDVVLKTDGFENDNAIALNKLGSYVTGVSNKDGGVAEIVSYDAKNNQAWVVNGVTGKLDIVDLSSVTCAVSTQMTAKSLDIKALVNDVRPDFTYGDMTSVSVNSQLGIAAVALQDEDCDKNGYVAFVSIDGKLLALIPAGIQPDMVTFTPDGSKVLTANEGEPRNGVGDGVTDPAGSVTIITLNTEDLTQSTSDTVGFEAYDAKRDELVNQGVIFRKDALPSVDLEPEYIACTDSMAYVALQEANAVAIFDLDTNKYTGIYSLGYKDLSLTKNAIDLVEDDQYVPNTYENAVGAYMPDGISLYSIGGQTYLLTANEGDAREWGSGDTEYANEKKVTLTAADGTQAKKIRVIDPDVSDGLPEGKNVLFGGRSFSIYRVDSNGLTPVYDSANDFEKKTAAYLPGFFNCSNDDNEYDSRSAKKGPEPESVTVGTVNGSTYAFVALERIGGLMMYDITDPANARFVNYINSRDFSENPEAASPDDQTSSLKSDIAPEGLYFIDAETSPSGTPILLSACEVSGTVAAYSVGSVPGGHAFGDAWDSDGDKHWHTCAKCGAITDEESHTGGTATCTEQAKCEKCEAYYGDAPEGHRRGEWETVTEATCEEAGEKVVKCVNCGEVLDAEIIPATGHNYSAWKLTRLPGWNRDGELSRTCRNCGETMTKIIKSFSSWFKWN